MHVPRYAEPNANLYIQEFKVIKAGFSKHDRIKAEVASSTIHTQFNTKPFPILDLGSALPIYELQCASVVKFSEIKGFYNRTPPFQRFMHVGYDIGILILKMGDEE